MQVMPALAPTVALIMELAILVEPQLIVCGFGVCRAFISMRCAGFLIGKLEFGLLACAFGSFAV